MRTSHTFLKRLAPVSVIGLAIFLCLAESSGRQSGAANAQDAATVIVGGVVGKEVLDEAEQKARDLLLQAQSTGDYLMWQFASNVLSLVEKSRLEASSLVDQTDAAIAEQRNRAFLQIQELLGQAETNLQEAYLKADTLTANLSNAIARIPFIDDSAEVLSVQPAVLPPLSVEKVIEFIGPGLGEADVVATLPDGQKVELTSKSSVSAYLKLVPLEFAATDGNAKFIEIKIDFVKARAKRYCLWCSDETTTRTIPILVPPKIPGKVRLIHTTETVETERRSFVVALNTHGKRINIGHPVNIPPHLKDAGFKIDSEAVTASTQPGGSKLITRVWGYSGSCPGPNLATLRDDGFIFNVYAGATCDWKGCDPGNQTCEISVPLIKPVVKSTSTAGEFKDLSWAEPTLLIPDLTAKSAVIELERPDGSRIQFPTSERVLEVTVTMDPETGGFRLVPFVGAAH